MPIRIPDSLPARAVLESENIFVMTEYRAMHQDMRPLSLLILNLMPTKIVTETQLLRKLSNSPLQVQVELLHTSSHISQNTDADHLSSFYTTFEQIKNRKFDGMIITGAPVENLDFTDVERRRGITVFSAQAEFCHGRNRYFLVDTPGHVDFSPEMERSLSVLDYAVLVISCVDGIQAHTETLWRLLRERGLPVFCFLNKADCPGADPELVLRQLHDRFGGGFCAFSDGLTESVREQIALTDDESLALYLDGALDEPSCWEAAARAVKRRALFPVFVGSALSGSGVEALMDGLDRICRTAYDLDGPTEASVYQVRHDRQGNRVAFCNVCSGVLQP